jgi:hypothetical protein
MKEDNKKVRQSGKQVKRKHREEANAKSNREN